MKEEFKWKYPLDTSATKHLAIGRLYKLNQLKLPEDCPLRDVKVVKVMKKGYTALLLAYPTLDALKTHFQKPDRMRIPPFPREHALDLKFVDALYEMVSNAEMMSDMIANVNYWMICKPAYNDSLWGMLALSVEDKERTSQVQKSERGRKETKQPVAEGVAESDFKKRMDVLTLAVLAMPGSMLSSFNWTNFDFGSSLTKKVMLQKLQKELENQIGMLTKHKESICQTLDLLEAKGKGDIAEISE